MALVASSAVVESVSGELSNKLSSLLVETGTIHFGNIPRGSGSTQEVFFSKGFPVDNVGVVATLNSWAAYWAGLQLLIVTKTSSGFILAIWNNDTANDVNNIYVSWQAIYDGRN